MAVALPMQWLKRREQVMRGRAWACLLSGLTCALSTPLSRCRRAERKSKSYCATTPAGVHAHKATRLARAPRQSPATPTLFASTPVADTAGPDVHQTPVLVRPVAPLCPGGL
jgi:hypothetical protein